jgi:hypothetical protein
MTGQPVRRGDRVYRPPQGKSRTSNARAVILAAAIEIEARPGG